MRMARWALGLLALWGLIAVAHVGGQGLPQMLMYGVYNGAPRALAVDASGNLNISASISGVDGTIQDGATPSIEVTVRDYLNSNPLAVAITDANGDLVSSFGGGIQYTEGDTDTTITGTALLFESNTGTSALGVVSSATPLPITATNLDIQSGGADLLTTTQGTTIITSLDALDNAVSGAGFNLTQLGGAAIPMTTTQADALAATLDSLNVSAFLYAYNGTSLDLVRGSTTDGLLVNLGANNDVTVTGPTGSGTATGALRVELANNGTGALSTLTSLTQFNGNAISTNNGTAGAGVLRVAIASDNSAVSGLGIGATGSAPPANANYISGLASGATGGLTQGIPVCDQQAFLNMTTATTTEIVPLTASRTVHICHIRANANGTTTMTFQRGTGTNCGTGTTAIDAGYNLTAQVGFAAGSGFGEVLSGSSAGNAVCVTNSAAVNLQVFVRYAVY